MRKVETGRFYGTKSVKEADDGHDNRTALSALLALVDADGMCVCVGGGLDDDGVHLFNRTT